MSGSLRGETGILRGETGILRGCSCAFSSGSRRLGGLARRFTVLTDLIECFAILLLMLAGLFGDPPDAFGFASRSFVYDATFLGDSKVLFFGTRRRIRGVLALIRH